MLVVTFGGTGQELGDSFALTLPHSSGETKQTNKQTNQKKSLHEK
jgi:hypothetical protein